MWRCTHVIARPRCICNCLADPAFAYIDKMSAQNEAARETLPGDPERNSVMHDAAYLRHFGELLHNGEGKRNNGRQGLPVARLTAREQQIRSIASQSTCPIIGFINGKIPLLD